MTFMLVFARCSTGQPEKVRVITNGPLQQKKWLCYSRNEITRTRLQIQTKRKVSARSTRARYENVIKFTNKTYFLACHISAHSKETKKAKNENITSIFAWLRLLPPLLGIVLPSPKPKQTALFCVRKDTRPKRKHHERTNGPESRQ